MITLEGHLTTKWWLIHIEVQRWCEVEEKCWLTTYHHERLDDECHHNDVIMTTMASEITSLTVVYLTVYSDADQRKHQSSASLAFVWGIHRDRWIPRTKGQLRGKCFHLMTSSWLFQTVLPKVYSSMYGCVTKKMQAIPDIPEGLTAQK